MNYIFIFVLCFVALTAAKPQLLTWPNVIDPYASRTIIAGPTVLNEGLFSNHIIAPGTIGTRLV